MADWLTSSWTDVLMVLVSVLGIYVGVIVCTRLAGLRSFSKMSSFDFAITVAIGSIIASTVLASSPPLAQALVALAALYVVQMVAAKWRERSSWFSRLLDNEPKLLMIGDQFLDDNLRKTKVTRNDIWAKLREANVLDLSEVRAVVLEGTGDVSVLHGPSDGSDLDPILLTGIVEKDQERFKQHEASGASPD